MTLLDQSDGFLEGAAGGGGGGVGGGRLDGLVGHDARGELLLGLFEAGVRGTVQAMDLERREG